MPFSFASRRWWPAVAGLPVALPAAAQVVAPDAGQLLEQVRPPLPVPEAAPAPAPEVAPAAPADAGPRFRVNRLQVTGATVFTEAQLRALVDDVENTEVTLSELSERAGRITRFYRDRGYILARAVVPQQEVADGTVEIRVIEGRLGTVTQPPQSVVGGAALAPLQALKAGEIARAGTLERSLLLLSDLPGVVVSSTLKPGTAPGTSDLLVDVARGAFVTGSVDLDANGDRFTGRTRAGGTLNLNNPLRLGDQLSFRGRSSGDGLNFLSGSYTVPINGYGTRIGASVSELQYALGDTLAAVGFEGKARTVSGVLLQPLVRSRRANVNAEIDFDDVTLEDRVQSTSTAIDKSVKVWNLGLSGNWLDDWRGSTVWSLQYSDGRLALDPTTAAIDAASARAAGSFSKWGYSLRRLQGITATTSLWLSVSGQVAGKNLDSSQKMSLGGANGVRAYPQGEGFGDQGYVATVELRRTLPVPVPGLWEAGLFYDHGRIDLNKNPWTTAANTRTLTGAGLGLTGAWGAGWSVRASIAWRTGDELPRADGDRRPRGWLQISKAF